MPQGFLDFYSQTYLGGGPVSGSLNEQQLAAFVPDAWNAYQQSLQGSTPAPSTTAPTPAPEPTTAPTPTTNVADTLPRTQAVKIITTNIKSLDNTEPSGTYTDPNGNVIQVTAQQKAALEEFYNTSSKLSQTEKDTLLSKAFTDPNAPQNNLSQNPGAEFGGGGVQDDFIASGSNFVEGTPATQQAGATPGGLDPTANNAGPTGTVPPDPTGPNAGPIAPDFQPDDQAPAPTPGQTPGPAPGPVGQDPGQDPPGTPPQPGDPPPTDHIPPDAIANPPDLLKEFLESDPALILNHVLNQFRDGGASNVFVRWFGSQFNSFYGRYLGYVAEQALGGQVPTLSFMDYISSFDSTKAFFQNSAINRGDPSSRFASFASSAGAN